MLGPEPDLQFRASASLNLIAFDVAVLRKAVGHLAFQRHYK